MVRSSHTDRAAPPDVIDRIVRNGLRAPSAGFSQGWGFLMLDSRVQPAGQTLTRPVTARSARSRAREHPARPAAPGNLGVGLLHRRHYCLLRALGQGDRLSVRAAPGERATAQQRAGHHRAAGEDRG